MFQLVWGIIGFGKSGEKYEDNADIHRLIDIDGEQTLKWEELSFNFGTNMKKKDKKEISWIFLSNRYINYYFRYTGCTQMVMKIFLNEQPLFVNNQAFYKSNSIGWSKMSTSQASKMLFSCQSLLECDAHDLW